MNQQIQKIATTSLTNHPVVMKTISTAWSHQYFFVDGSVLNSVRQLPLLAEINIIKRLLNATSATWHATDIDKIQIDLKGNFIKEREAEKARKTADQLLALASIRLNVASAEIEKNTMASKDWK